MQGTIQKWGNSHAVRLPKPMLESVSLKEHDPIQILVVGGDIVIRKPKPAAVHRTLAERLRAAGLPAEFRTDDGEHDASAVGSEVFW